jgi:tetratricopeptide (TPR) repeat protein
MHMSLFTSYLSSDPDLARGGRGTHCRVPSGQRPGAQIVVNAAAGAHSAPYGWLAMACFLAVSLVTLSSAARGEPLRVDNPAASGEKKYPEIEEARKKLAQQDVDGALEALNAAAKAHPDLASGRVQLAHAYFAINRARDARLQLEKAVMDNPDDADAYLAMADLALRDGQWTVAALLSDKSLALAQAFKGDAEKKKDLLKRAYSGAAYAAQSHERWEDARKLLNALIKVEADNANAHFQLGQVLFELKKPKDAYAELQAAARMDERVASPEATLGRLYEKAKDRANAEKWMKQAVAGDPKRLETRMEVAQWYLSIGRIDDAKAQVEAALGIDPESQEALYLAGRVSRFAKDFGQAQKYLEKAYLESPGAGREANELALTLNELGEEDRKRALTLADANVRQNRQSAEAVATLGWIYYRLGRMDEAESLLNQVVASNQSVSPDAVYFSAVVADNRNHPQVAKTLLDTALKSDAPFAYRPEAQKLHDRLAKTPASSRGARPTKQAATKSATKDE